MPLWDRLMRCGVPGRGDCGIIAPLAAFGSYHQRHTSTELTDQQIMDQRRSMLAFLSDKAIRVAGAERVAVDVEELRSSMRELRSYVAVEYLWLFAMRHRVNIYLVGVGTIKSGTRQETQSHFYIRLITSEANDCNMRPIASDKPNTIAVYLHTIRALAVNEEVKAPSTINAGTAGTTKPRVIPGTGHFEYLVDSTSGRSCWSTDDDVVMNVLQPAMMESYRIGYLNQYTQRWSDSHNRRLTDRLPKIAVGDIAMLMISDWVRGDSCYDPSIDGAGLRNMVVKVIDKKESRPTRYEVLSHAGVVSTWLLQQEFRMLGQDVDTELRARVVTESMRRASEKVGVLQAWDFFIERRRARHIDMAQRQSQSMSTEAASQEELPEESKESATVVAQPVAKASLTHICCSCQEPIHLSAGREPAVCLGLCQQPMHSNPGTCKRSSRWVRAGRAGVCCSKACAVLFVTG